MALPAPLSDLAWKEIRDFAKEKHMPFMTGADRYGRREGLLAGIEAVLDVKFGAPGLALLPEIRQIDDTDLLRQILQSVKQADNPEALRRVWADA